MSVKEAPFTSLLSNIVDNRGRTAPTATSGIPLIATNCIKDGRLYPMFEKVRYVTQETYDTWFRAHPMPGDIIFVCKGSPGRVALVPDPVSFCIAQDMVAVRADPTKVYPRYLLAALRSAEVRRRIDGMHVGTMIPHFKKGDFKNLQIPLLDIDDQTFVGDWYFDLSSKIESNRRAIALLQDLIRATFVEWKERFPAKRTATFGDFADIYGGATPKTDVWDYWNGGLAWVTPTDVTALSAPYLFRTARTISEAGLTSTSASLHPIGTILMTSRATIGAFAVNEVPTATNQGFIAVRPREPHHRWFLLEEMRSRVPEMLDRANGSTFMELSRGNFKAISIDLPTESELTELHSLLGPLHERSSQLDRECSNLANFRDTLLPELLSGRIRVLEAQEVPV